VTTQETIRTDRAPAAVGPYSQGVRSGSLLFTSGQLPMTREGELIVDDIERAARRAFANVEAVLDAGGASLADVVKVTIYLAEMNDFAAVNAVYAETFQEPFPARSCVEVARLPLDAPIEVEAVAVVA
jgi:2-iminobutanoate/2-iminopropanoate deaminase